MSRLAPAHTNTPIVIQISVVLSDKNETPTKGSNGKIRGKAMQWMRHATDAITLSFPK